MFFSVGGDFPKDLSFRVFQFWSFPSFIKAAIEKKIPRSKDTMQYVENISKLESFANFRNGGDVPLQFDFTRIMRKSTCTKKNATLEDLGYKYCKNGEKTLLRAIYNENWGFKWRGQKHYNALSKAMLKEVKRRMLEQGLSEETRSDRTTILKSDDLQSDTVLV